jgi:polyhydroxybutyrate depolymerase
MNKLILLITMIVLSLLLISTSCSEAPSPAPMPTPPPAPTPKVDKDIPKGIYDMSIEVDTLTRWFKVVIPSAYDHTDPRPLLFCFHGGGLSMDTYFNRRQDLVNRCEEENWILVFPNGANAAGDKGDGTWNAVHCCDPALKYNVDDIGFVKTMIDRLSSRLKIDTKRIYATGFSNGGMLTHRIAAELPDLFAAVAPGAATIGGQVDSLSPVVTVQPTQPIPIIMIHGKDDWAVKYNGGPTDGGSSRIDLSFKESVLFWANHNLCTLDQVDTAVIDGLKGEVRIDTFHDCDGDVKVQAISIENLGHGWASLANSGFDGTNAIVDFLKQFSK